MMEAALYAEIYLICMIIVGLLLYWSLKSNSRSASEQWLIRCFEGFLGAFTSNFFFTLINGGLIAAPIRQELCFMLKTAFFALVTVSVFAWRGFAEIEANRGRHGSGGRRKPWLFYAQIVPALALIAVNLWTRTLFSLDGAGGYHRGPLYHALMLYLAFVSMPDAVKLAARHKAEFSPSGSNYLLITASFPVCLLLAWSFSFVEASESLPAICVLLTINLLCIYEALNQQQISMDKLTQVNNRQNLIGFINYKLINHESRLYVLMIDVDFFKPINDTYGHLEGDHALIRVADALKHSCNTFKRRPFIARYGGDEFIIVLEGTQEDADRLCDSIRQHLRESQEKENAPYDLTVSIGVAGYRSGMMSKDLISAADDDLYRVKQSRDKSRAPAGHH